MSGTTLGGRYVLGREIGYGGMAVVYQAHDTVLDRDVAVKVMQPLFTRDASFEQRFEREAKSAAALTSPYVVSIYDWGNSDGFCFIVMELLRGRDVKELIAEKGPFDCRATARIASQMCGALSEAHSKGIIHRDVKPQNIMVLPDGNTKLMDFGIARPGTSNLTMTSVVLGTAHYISPEQAQVGDIGPASDIYSLGAVMYECVTGQVPFDGETSTTVALKQVTEKPVPPSEVNPLVDPVMEDIILKCLAKRPEQRFASASELKGVLDTYIRGQHVQIGRVPDMSSAETVMINPVSTAYNPTKTQVISKNGQKQPAKASQRLDDPKRYQAKSDDEFWTTGKKVVLGIVIAVLVAVVCAGIWTFLNRGSSAPANTNQNTANVVENASNASNDGPKQAVVPDLRGKTRDQAIFSVESIGFRIGNIEERYSEDIEAGTVMEQDPAGGSRMPEGTYISLVISKGSEMVQVPNVVGMPSETAQRALINQGLRIGSVTEEESSQESGTVIRQSVVEKATRGTEVDLVISAGAKKVNIPGVVGKTLSQAYADLSGFQVVVNGSEDPDAIVTHQTTGQIEEGGTVTLTTKAPSKNENGNENGNSNSNSSNSNTDPPVPAVNES